MVVNEKLLRKKMTMRQAVQTLGHFYVLYPDIEGTLYTASNN